jgi:hypothetical protein
MTLLGPLTSKIFIALRQKEKHVCFPANPNFTQDPNIFIDDKRMHLKTASNSGMETGFSDNHINYVSPSNEGRHIVLV